MQVEIWLGLAWCGGCVGAGVAVCCVVCCVSCFFCGGETLQRDPRSDRPSAGARIKAAFALSVNLRLRMFPGTVLLLLNGTLLKVCECDYCCLFFMIDGCRVSGSACVLRESWKRWSAKGDLTAPPACEGGHQRLGCDRAVLRYVLRRHSR
jgi:hypothetical protein